jgi:hypothetical protein
MSRTRPRAPVTARRTVPPPPPTTTTRTSPTLRPSIAKNHIAADLLSALGLSDEAELGDELEHCLEEVVWCFSRARVERRSRLPADQTPPPTTATTTTTKTSTKKQTVHAHVKSQQLDLDQLREQPTGLRRRGANAHESTGNRLRNLTTVSSYGINHFDNRHTSVNNLAGKWTQSLNFGTVQLPPLLISSKMIKRPVNSKAFIPESQLRLDEDEASHMQSFTNSIASGTLTCRSEMRKTAKKQAPPPATSLFPQIETAHVDTSAHVRNWLHNQTSPVHLLDSSTPIDFSSPIPTVREHKPRTKPVQWKKSHVFNTNATKTFADFATANRAQKFQI